MATFLSKLFGGNQNKVPAKQAQAGASALLSPAYTPIEKNSATAGRKTFQSINPPQFDVTKIVKSIQPDPKYNAQVGTGAIAPMMSKLPIQGPKATNPTLANAALQGAKALTSVGESTKPKTTKGSGGKQTPQTPQTPTSDIKQQAQRLLSNAGYISGYKPKKDFLKNPEKDEEDRLLRMFGPFKSIE